MEIGSVIGKLRINGNPHTEKGDINLSLRERDAPVKIPPGTKNIVLIAPLDKEGIKGSSSIYVDVICDRKHSTDPVSIRLLCYIESLSFVLFSPLLLTKFLCGSYSQFIINCIALHRCRAQNRTE